MEALKQNLIAVAVDFEVDAWEFWEAVDGHPFVARLCPEMQCLLVGDLESVRIRRHQADEAIFFLSKVRGWLTGDKLRPFPLRFTAINE